MAHIFQINASSGGVPKKALPSATIDQQGLTTDKQANKKHHGGPLRAVCLFSLERILALQAEGHPIYPGSTGENLTIAGLDWAQVAPGTRLRLGREKSAVILEITSFAVPCKNIRASFKQESFGRISHKRYAGWARAYARVLRGGETAVGAPVYLETADADPLD